MHIRLQKFFLIGLYFLHYKLIQFDILYKKILNYLYPKIVNLENVLIWNL